MRFFGAEMDLIFVLLQLTADILQNLIFHSGIIFHTMFQYFFPQYIMFYFSRSRIEYSWILLSSLYFWIWLIHFRWWVCWFFLHEILFLIIFRKKNLCFSCLRLEISLFWVISLKNRRKKFGISEFLCQKSEFHAKKIRNFGIFMPKIRIPCEVVKK